jgi:hypothetical protein
MAETVSINNKRYYKVWEKEKLYHFPSVTTILGAMNPDTGIEDWKKRIGKDKAEKIGKLAANRGTVMHMYCENYLNSFDLKKALKETYDWSKENGFTEQEIDIGRNLFYNFFNKNTFKDIDEVVIQEKMLYSKVGGGYAGRVDLIYRKKNGNIVIADFKTAKKPKKKEWIKTYFMQLSAYFIAYYYMTGEKAEKCEILMSNELDNNPQIFTLNQNEIVGYFKEFKEWTEKFHSIYDKERDLFLEENI